MPRKPSTAVAPLLLVVGVAAFLAGCDRGPARTPGVVAKKVAIAVTPWPASAPLYVAREKGYFRDEGLDAALHPYASGHLGLAAVLAGKADFACLGETPIARAAVDGKPLAVVATVCEIEPAIQIIARKDRRISKGGDLVGRKVGMVAGTTADFFLHVYLTTSNIDPKDVRIVDLAAGDVVKALLKGDVDAVSTWAPHTTALQDGLGANGVVLFDPGLYTMTWNVIAAKDLTRRDPDIVVRVLRAIVRGNRLIAERPAEARAIAAQECGMDIGAVEREWRNYKWMAQLDQSLILGMEDQARWMLNKKPGREGTLPNFLDCIYTEGLKAVQPDAVRVIVR